jgi:hypothetical protein
MMAASAAKRRRQRPWLVVGRVESAAERRLHAKHVKVTGAHALTIETFRLGRSGQRRSRWSHHCERFERASALGHFPEAAEGDRQARAVGAVVPDGDDSMRIRIRKAVEEDRLGGAEHGATRTDSQRERGDDDGSESRTGSEAARAVSQIGEKGFDHALPAAGAHLFAHHCRVAELQPGGAACLFRSEPGGEVGRGCLVQIVRHLVLDGAFGDVAMRERVEAAGERAPERHG